MYPELPGDKPPKIVLQDTSSESSFEFEFDNVENVPETSLQSDTSPEQCDAPSEDSEKALVRTPGADQVEFGTESFDQFEFGTEPFELIGSEQFEFFSSGILSPEITPMSFERTLIPRSPSSTRHTTTEFYLAYHRERINGYYYYSYYDYGQLFTKGLFTMAEESNALYFGLIAFSAFIYSVRIDPSARHVAYGFYSLTVQELRLLLDKPMDRRDCYIATVCAMQLSSFDRFACDEVKCFRHLEGAARIMKRYTTAIEQSSTALGRSILEWFFGFEDNYCVFAAYKSMLPPFWRQEDIRIRTSIAEMEYKYLTADQRIPRILDDVWAQMYISGYQLREILEETPRLKSLDGIEKIGLATELESNLRKFDNRFKQFMCSPLVLEVLEPSQFDVPYDVVEPCFYKYPPVATFKIAALCLQTYIRSSLHPLLCAGMEEYTELEGTAAELAVEICRAYAGLEICESDEILIPCHSSLIISGFTCPVELRMWVYSKLLQLENLGQCMAEPFKRNLAAAWNMPDLATTFQEGRLEEVIEDLEEVNLEEALEPLEPLTQLRGIFLDSP